MRALLFFSFLSVAGCGGSVAAEPVNTDGGADAVSLPDTFTPPPDTFTTTPDAPMPMAGVTPPPRPSVAATGSTRWYVVSKVYLGLSDRSGVVSPNAWRAYGYDLDARSTTPEDSKGSTNSCKRVPGSMTKVLTDGDLGRDNNFGQHFMAVMKSLKADVEDAMNAAIADGSGTTMLLRLDNVGPDDNASVPGALFRTVPTGKVPTFTEADHLTIDFGSVDVSKEPVVKFPKGYMSGGTWVSGNVAADRVPIALPGIGFGGAALIDMPQGVMSFDVKTGKNGVIAGAIGPLAFMNGLDGGLRAAGVCPGNATYDQIAAIVQQSSDLVLGAPDLQDTLRVCSALSIGIGFDARPSGAWGAISGPTKPPPDMCP